MKLVLSAVAVASLCAAPVWAQSDKSKNTETHDTRPEPPMLGKHLAKGQGARPTRTPPQLTYHGGAIMTGQTVVTPIFWGTSWNSPASQSKKTALTQFYSTVGGTPYLATNIEYTFGTAAGAAHVSTDVHYSGGAITDTTAAPKSGSQTTPFLNEVCAKISGPISNGYYPVYVDTPRGSAGFCAWHSWGTCNGTPVQFAFFFNLDGDPGCDPGDTTTGHSQGVAALGNVTGHELSEMLTDPRGAGWFDNTGAENSDKCAWTWNGTVDLGGTNWKIQGNWSNAATTAKTGYGTGNYIGCIQQTP
jgi:hypothetical protein